MSVTVLAFNSDSIGSLVHLKKCYSSNLLLWVGPEFVFELVSSPASL